MLLGLDVLPEYRHQGLAREIMTHYAAREQAKGRKCLYLTCLDQKVEMYKKWATPTMASPVPSGEAKSGTI